MAEFSHYLVTLLASLPLPAETSLPLRRVMASWYTTEGTTSLAALAGAFLIFYQLLLIA
jgi:hypothetical protein